MGHLTFYEQITNEMRTLDGRNLKGWLNVRYKKKLVSQLSSEQLKDLLEFLKKENSERVNATLPATGN